ncbi:MAG: hypothetical protein ACKVVP_04300 [Chloroflexota bacterium]
MAGLSRTETHASGTTGQVCPFDHKAWSTGEAEARAVNGVRSAPEPPDCMVLYFMQGACLLPQSMQFCGFLVARELVRRPQEIDLVEFANSRLSERQADKVIRAMNAVHVKNQVLAQWRPDDALQALAAQALFKLRKVGLRTLRPITQTDVDGAWESVKSEGIGRLFSLARVVPDFPCRERLPLNARSASARSLELTREVLGSMQSDSALLGLLEDASDLVVHDQMFREEKREYKQAVRTYGSYTPQADACRDRIAAHVLTELQQRHPQLDWAAYRDYRHV